MLTEVPQTKNKEAEVEEGESSQGRNGGFDRSKYKKLNMPVFDGEGPNAWIFRAETFFEIHKLSDTEKMKVVVISFSQEVVDWYRWANNRKPIRNWKEMKERMLERWRPTLEGTLTNQLLTIKQEGAYADYRQKFEIFSAPLPNLKESVLVTAFLNGLHPSLKAEVVSRRPVGLDRCMLEAQSIDDRDIALKLALVEVGFRQSDRKGEQSPMTGVKPGAKGESGSK